MITILEKSRAPSRNVFCKGPMIQRTGRIDRESGGFETAYHHEAHASHLIRLGPGNTEFRRRDDVPEAENFPEGEQLERRTLVADLAADFDVGRTARQTLRLGIGLEDGDEFVLVRLRLDLVHADGDEMAIHLLDAVLYFRLVRHRIDVHRATGELADVVALLEVLDGIDEFRVTFDLLALPKLDGGLSNDLVQPVEVHTLSPFVWFGMCDPADIAGLLRYYKDSILLAISQAQTKIGISASFCLKSYEFND
ncbi:MAG: hypothetical protein UW55_C0048G0002 [Candidatus Giovannonibacteria bacterium GW2011_GWA2_44_26]|uniref:Uncharacterized protein n=1 Tax=Candidatus Giovannonibacteria bacterium GW2011_GWA2_44_26 TaxID=1618648 RepID=A0A0G1LL56_9BACT|nr:MAG: hypothetical protein UW55_C0048G0002 [Candidatus Giovannonibacteria bacterium GW2011_GWA2_44_26]